MFFNAQFIAAGSVMLANALIAFIVSLIYGNHGHIDRTWSVVPAIYAWIFASAYLDVRTATISILITLWAIRLSFNFYRRGGYSGYEDYRWPILRKKIPNILLWQMFNIVFICLYQSVLLFLIAVPVHIAAIAPTPIYWTDMLSIVLFVFFLYTETLADQQQWEFQNKKHEFINSGEQVPEPYSAGFCQEGLFKYSRHPNFFSEQSLWW
jgi:steroid 5-alpha reductase family enzyme